MIVDKVVSDLAEFACGGNRPLVSAKSLHGDCFGTIDGWSLLLSMLLLLTGQTKVLLEVIMIDVWWGFPSGMGVKDDRCMFDEA